MWVKMLEKHGSSRLARLVHWLDKVERVESSRVEPSGI